MGEKDKIDQIFNELPLDETVNEPEADRLADQAEAEVPLPAQEEDSMPLPHKEHALVSENMKTDGVVPLQENGQASEENTVPPVVQEAPPVLPAKRRQKNEFHFFALALVPLVLLILLGGVLVVIKLTSGESESLFSLFKDSSGEPMEAFMQNADREIRGVYVATAYNINYPSKQNRNQNQLKRELDHIIDTCLSNRLNTIYFQVSPNSDALYVSDILPYSYVLTGTEGKEPPGGFDPLAYLLEQAHEKNIEVHAWVNPVRVSTESLSFDRLSADNPARVHPEWTVEYGGVVYYNLSHPEARALQASVCAELAEKYDIDGILFDDYFYPYPKENETFDDEEEYSTYGSEFDDIADYRRHCTTEMVKSCYEAIKEKAPDCLFGIAPFGIWQNDDGLNGGSATKGFESYESLYCDTLDFIKQGCVDYVAPQLYWQMDYNAASYTVLCHWWNAAVEGTGVNLLISHAAYKAADWASETEFVEQVSYAEKIKNYRGSIFYGLAAIEGNDAGITSQLYEVYESERVYIDFYSTGEEVKLTSVKSEGDTVWIEGTSDVFYSLYYGEKRLSQQKDGSFSCTVAKPADGKICLKQNEREYVFPIEES
ncbi:MAG: family 10 glycosylhydrolase [Clostridiales bacterium]|nr:family 10 glycosylhydrolase [Clostridiales bacterium]